ncbi:MAG: bifunctional glutamate N-acetyltransferase/amino-acid acetyltransferase ArgJ [Thiovulaceae bacterium]|nr:bifunctional glutamate N-acetyltransferase/amino-acid acetyltransferase ArgJ [Sulfurimonadaceae bacterium]
MLKLTPNKDAICAVKGFYANGISAGLKPNGAKDLAFIYADTPCDVAAIYTTNKMLAAPLQHAKAKGKIKSNFLLINSKNANAMTGTKGVEDIETILKPLQEKFPQITSPLMSSTGVIGVYLPIEKITQAALKFDLNSKEPMAAAQAIMTTDRFSKTIAFDVETEEGNSFSIGAMAKGAGMINPAMATMLCFISTDIALPHDEVQKILERVNIKTFNAASVDGDTSTNDTVFVMNNHKSNCSDALAFEEALSKVMDFLAQEMVRDGEGATKLITYNVVGALDDSEAERAAKALSNSLLIKTAFNGEDPNWGRIAMSIGACGINCHESTLTIAYDDVLLVKKGQNLFNETVEKAAEAVLKKERFSVNVDLGVAQGCFTAYGCDLGHEYVKINADYRT